jgi:hypothetical protein
MKFLLIRPPNENNFDLLNNFYNTLSVSYLYNLMEKKQVMIKLTCFQAKNMYKKEKELFFKFDLQLKN